MDHASDVAADDGRFDAIIVGAGFSGISTLYHLTRQGLRVVLFEAGSGVGGTWYHNRYPGARCDIESLDYSFSFSEELQQEWTWSERYSSQGEIQRYVSHVAERFDLMQFIQLDTKVTAAKFDEVDSRWTVETEGGTSVDAKYLVLGTGVLSAAQVPQFPGLSSFGGRWYHTADWPREGVDFTGKQVAVIGTGSSATQLIPIVAEQAKSLTVFQRTANFVMPARNRPMSPEDDRAWKANYGERRRIARASFSGHNQPPPTRAGRDLTEEERVEEFERRWQLGGLHMMRSFTDLLTDPVVNDHASEFVRGKIREIVKDPNTAEVLSPRGLPFATKRLCSGTNYYETFNRDNVKILDARKDPIVEITPEGLRTESHEYTFDALILATGFDAMTGSFQRIDIRGRDDVRLRDHWAFGPRTFMGVATSGFPNLFIMAGPQSPSVFSNMVTSAEQHAEWVRDCIAYLEDHQISSIEATAEAESRWIQHVTDKVTGTLYEHSQNSWFWGANIPGKPRVFTPYFGGVGNYVRELADVAADDYEGFILREDGNSSLATSGEKTSSGSA